MADCRYMGRLAGMVGAVLVAFGMAGCSAQQTYQAGQTWQRNECQKLSDAQARGNCLDSANASFEAYQRQVETDIKTQRD